MKIAVAAFILIIAWTACLAQEQLLPGYLIEDLSLSVGSGARAFGMGGAFIAVADDGTAAAWNPAGLAVLMKPEASVVWSPYAHSRFDLPGEHYQSATEVSYLGQSRTTLNGGALEFASVAYPLTAGPYRIVPQISYQRAILMGTDRRQTPVLFRSRGADGSQYSRTSSLTSDGSGGIDIVALGLAINLDPRLQIGMTINRWYNGASTDLTSQAQAVACAQGSPCVSQSAEGQLYIDERFKGWNATFGILVKPASKVTVGAVYKTGFEMDHEFRYVGGAFQYNELGTIHWPVSVGLGVAFVPSDQWTVSADYAWIDWSAAEYFSRSRFDPLDEYTDNPTVIWPTTYNPSLSDDPIRNAPQRDVTHKRVGVEYAFFKKWIIPVRGGLFQEKHFQPDANGNRITLYGLTAGAGLVFPHLAIDVALVHEMGHPDGCHYQSSELTCLAEGNVDFSFNKFYLSTIYRF